MCIDDEEIVLDSLQMELSNSLDDYIVETAESGEDALELLEELNNEGCELQAVISDYIMPNMKGDILLRHIHDRYPSAVKIMLTGQASTEGISNAVNNAGLYRFITKPWDNTDLVLTIKEGIKSYRQNKLLAEQNIQLKKININLEEYREVQNTINSLLQLVLERIDLSQQLTRSLNLILSAPWFALQKKGAIFLADNESKILKMVASKGINAELLSSCKNIPFGTCLCGTAAKTKQVVFADCVDERHEIGFDGMTEHGHYCMPIIYHDELMGVLNVYVKEGHSREKKLEKFLFSVGHALAGMIRLEIFNQSLKQHNNDLEEMVRIRTAQLTKLLDNSGQGFLSFGKDLIIESQYSKECEILFHETVYKRSIANLLYPNNPTGRANLKNNIIRILNEKSDLKRELFLSLLPKTFQLYDKHIDAEFKVVGSEQIMLILTDVTIHKELETHIYCERNRLKFVVSTVRESDDFFEIVDDFNYFFTEKIPALFSENVKTKDMLPDIYRSVHTFKGLFAQQDFENIPEALHNLETSLVKLSKEGSISINNVVELLESSECQHALDKDLATIEEALGKEFMQQKNKIVLTQKQLENIDCLIDSILPKKQIVGDNALQKCVNELRTIRHANLKQMLQSYPKGTMKLAERLGKNIHPFEIEGDDIFVNPIIYSAFIKTLIHVFRNAIDHGIETPDERLEYGKDECALLSCFVQRAGEKVIISIADDGKGIDASRIRLLAVNKGIYNGLQEASRVSDREICDLIFNEHFSTKQSITDLSGRGIGLSAVKTELSLLGGAVEISTTCGEGTSFTFILPNIVY